MEPSNAVEVKERGFPMRAAEVQALLAERKTQTRRVLKIGMPNTEIASMHPTASGDGWIAWSPTAVSAEDTARHYPSGGIPCPYGKPGDRLVIIDPATGTEIALEITDVRVQRLQDISDDDARAEGSEPWQFGLEQCLTSGERGAAMPYRSGFACFWDEINANRATWKSNPWVWALTFKCVGGSDAK